MWTGARGFESDGTTIVKRSSHMPRFTEIDAMSVPLIVRVRGFARIGNGMTTQKTIQTVATNIIGWSRMAASAGGKGVSCRGAGVRDGCAIGAALLNRCQAIGIILRSSRSKFTPRFRLLCG